MANRTRWIDIALWLIPPALVLVLYFQTHSHTYISLDDAWYTYENPMVSKGITWEGVTWSLTDSRFANYHPITWWSHMLDFTVLGNAPGWFAVENAMIHALNSLLVSLLLAKVFGSKTSGILGGIIFAVHPVLIEAVAWISQRKTLISTFWALLSMLLYLRCLDTENSGRRLLVLFASLFCFVLSLLAKSMYVTLPALLIFLELASAGKDRGLNKDFSVPLIKGDLLFLTKRILPFGVLSLIFAIVAVWAQSSGGAVAALEGFPMSSRLGNALFGYTTYSEQFFFPTGLSLFYPSGNEIVLCEHILRGFALLAISGLLYALRNRWGIKPLIGWLFFLVALLPVIGLVQIGAQSHADRYMYGPIIGLIISTVALGRFIQSQLGSKAMKNVAAFSMAIWLTLLIVAAYFHIGAWKNDYTIALATLKTYPANPIASQLMATSLIQHGHYEEARDILRRQIVLYPKYSINLSSLALCEFILGDTDEALKHQKMYVERDPRPGAGLVNLVKFYLALGRVDEAKAIIQNIDSHDFELRNSERKILNGIMEDLDKREASKK